MRRVLVGILVLGVVVSIIAYTFFQRYTVAFPVLDSGHYVGVCTVENGGRSFPWFVSQTDKENMVSVFIGDARIPAQRVAMTDPTGRTRLPLIVGDAETRMRFTGTVIAPGEYEGDFLNPVSNERGKWNLRSVPQQPMATGLEDDLVRWFSLWQELEHIEVKIQEVQQRADEQRDRIDNLHRYVSDGETLRKTADVRLGRTDSELESAKTELTTRQQQLDRNLRDFDLSQRISSEGKLVFLSREAIERESRWIDLTLKMLAPETSPGFDQALERAERVRSLRQQIADEQNAIAHTAEQSRYPGKTRETSNEEEFYEQLQ